MTAHRPRRGRPPLGDRRQEIIHAAQEILADRGYAHTSMKQIAAGAGIASAITAGFHGALYEALTLGEDPRPALTALRFMALSSAAMSYVAAGRRPPIDLDELRGESGTRR